MKEKVISNIEMKGCKKWLKTANISLSNCQFNEEIFCGEKKVFEEDVVIYEFCPECKLKRLTTAQTQKECIEYFLNFINNCETIICNSDKLEELKESLALMKKEFGI